MEKVGIVVVTYNRLSLLKEVVESLRNQTYNDYQIIVVNNGSTDNTLEWLKQQKDVYTITQDNLGGAGGFHTGMKYVAEHGFKYCWVMDDDVICNPSALEELVKAYNVKKEIGFVCSKVVGIDGCPMNTPDVEDRPSVNGYSDYYKLVEYQMIKVRQATFVSVLLSTDIIYEVGLPFKEYFIWGDDSEYTMRISSKYECYLVCKSKVLHKRIIQASLSFSDESDISRLKNYFYMFRNQAYNIKLYQGQKSYSERLNTLFKTAIKQFIHGNKSKSFLLLKSLLALRNFHPIVSFPERIQ